VPGSGTGDDVTSITSACPAAGARVALPLSEGQYRLLMDAMIVGYTG
jgi:hypothetical protein